MKPHRTAEPRAPQLLCGTWLSVGSPVIAELAAESGFDWLLFDLEHGCGSDAGLFGTLQAIKGTATAGIVRVGAPYPDLIMRALDWSLRESWCHTSRRRQRPRRACKPCTIHREADGEFHARSALMPTGCDR